MIFSPWLYYWHSSVGGGVYVVLQDGDSFLQNCWQDKNRSAFSWFYWFLNRGEGEVSRCVGWLVGWSLGYDWLSHECGSVFFACSVLTVVLFVWVSFFNSGVLITILFIVIILVIVMALPTYYMTQKASQTQGRCGRHFFLCTANQYDDCPRLFQFFASVILREVGL